MLFRTLLDDRDAFVFPLVEHHSRSDRFMPLRMVTYMVRIWTARMEAWFRRALTATSLDEVFGRT